MPQLNLIQILEAERFELGETQEVFAEHFGIYATQYSSAKTGRIKFPVKCLQLMSEFLGIPLEDVQKIGRAHV